MNRVNFEKAAANSGAVEQRPFEKRGNRSTTGRGNCKKVY